MKWIRSLEQWFNRLHLPIDSPTYQDHCHDDGQTKVHPPHDFYPLAPFECTQSRVPPSTVSPGHVKADLTYILYSNKSESYNPLFIALFGRGGV